MYEIDTEDILKAQSKDEQAMEKIINNNAKLIWSIVNRFVSRGYSKEELYQIGSIGLIKSVQRFNTKFNVKISTFAVPYIMGEIKRFIRDDGPIKVSRSIKELAIKINVLQREYFEKNAEDISLEEICKKLNVPKEDVVVALECAKPLQSIDEQAYEENGESKLSKINVQKDETNILIDKLCLNKIINNLEDREKKIIMLRYYKEKTQSEVAKILGISQVQISRLEKNILINIRKQMI